MATDEELQALAQQAVDNGSVAPAVDPNQLAPDSDGQIQGVQGVQGVQGAQAAPEVPQTPNGQATEGPTEVPGDRAMDTVAPPPPRAVPLPNQSAVPVAAPLTEQGAVKALEGARQAVGNQANAQAAVAPAKAELSQATSEQQEKVAEESRRQVADLEAQQHFEAEGRAKAQDIADDAASQYKDFKFRDWWHDPQGGESTRARIFIALGAFAAAGDGGGKNAALESISNRVNSEYRLDAAKQKSLYDYSRLKQEGAAKFSQDMRDDAARLHVKNAARLQAIGDEAKSVLTLKGIPVEDAENDILVKGLRSKGEAEYAKGYGQLVKDKATEAMANAHLSLARETSRGNREDRRDARDATHADKLDARTINYADGTHGVAPTPRNVVMIGDRDTQYQDALDKLKNLRDSKKLVPYGADYDNAVLAVAAVTAANSSDKTTSHEAGSLKNWGVISKEALDTKIKELDKRRMSFRAEYKPSGATSEKSSTPTVVESRNVNGVTWDKMSDGNFVERGK